METSETLTTTNLPIDLLVWVIKDGIIKPSVLKTYLYFKLAYPDRIIKTHSLFSDIAWRTGTDVKTIRSHFKKLIQVKFLSVDKRTDTIFVRSKYKVIPRSKRISKYSLKINKQQLDHFTEYIVAAVVAYMVKKRMAQHKKALINDGALQRLCKVNRRYHIGLPISLSYIAKFLGKSISWVDKYKQKAKALNWLKSRRNWMETGVEWKFRNRYLSDNNISYGRAKKYRGKLYVVDSDLLSSAVIVIRRKKSV